MSKRRRRKPRIPRTVTIDSNPSGTFWKIVLLLDGLLIAFIALLPIPQASANAGTTAVVVLLLWQVVLFLSSRSPFQMEWKFRKPHCVQTGLQIILFIYWGLYWNDVASFAPLIAIQLVFAYLFDILLSWSRKKTWYGGLGQFPVVLSINLFLWFQPAFFFCQFLLIAMAYLGKEFVTWHYAGRKKHIFNPSAFALAIVAVALLLAPTDQPDRAAGMVETVTGSVEYSNRALDIVDSFSLAPNFYEVVFLLSLVVQFLFGTTLITLGAALAMCLMFAASGAFFDAPLFEVALNRSVFLGISLLVTDPSTSPKSGVGKFMFGLVYGGGVFLIDVVFSALQLQTQFDKILLVPVVNLLVPWLDRAATAIQSRIGVEATLSTPSFGRYASIAVYIGLFLVVIPAHKSPPLFQSPFPPPMVYSSAEMDTLSLSRIVCQLKHEDAFLPFGFASEVAQYSAIKELLRMDKGEAEASLLRELERLDAEARGIKPVP
jgi:hypothetical protein